jgi:predicted ATPase
MGLTRASVSDPFVDRAGMIERASFSQFKSLRRVDAELRRFTVIVGPNGSGKTSVLDGLHYLAQTTKRPLAAFLDGAYAPPNLKSRGAAGLMKLALSGRFQGIDASVEAEIECTDTALAPPAWNATVRRRWGDATEETHENRRGELPPVAKAGTPKSPPRIGPSKQGAPKPPITSAYRLHRTPEMARLAAELGSARKLRLDVEVLAAPSYSHEQTPRLTVDGKGLASVLADVAGSAPEVFRSITEAARRVIPSLERIRTRRAQVQERERQEIRIDDQPIEHALERAYWGQQIVLDFKGAPNVLAPLASEGTLLVIGLLTALWTEPRPRVLLLDDIDKALHPRAQAELVAQLRAVLEMDPELQIIATSHSPYLIDHFDAGEVLVTALDADGSTACAPLTAHADFERWRGSTQPGEMWSFLGEDWVTARAHGGQGRP